MWGIFYYNTKITAWIYSTESQKSANLGFWTSPVSEICLLSNSPYFKFRKTIFLKESILGEWKRIEFKFKCLDLKPSSTIKWLWGVLFYFPKAHNLTLKIEITTARAGRLWTQRVQMNIRVLCEQQNVLYIRGRKGWEDERLVEKWIGVLNKRELSARIKEKKILLQREGNNWDHRTLCYGNRNALLIITRQVGGQNSLITLIWCFILFPLSAHFSGPMSKHMGPELHSLCLSFDSEKWLSPQKCFTSLSITFSFLQSE